MEQENNKNNKKMIIIFSIIIAILVIIIIALIIKQQTPKMVFSLFGDDYSITGLSSLSQNDKKEENKNTIKYTKEQLNEEIYSFIERRNNYAVFKNLKGSELAKKLNTGSKMFDTSKVSNYEYGNGNIMSITEYIVLYKQGANHIKIIADSTDDSVIAIKYFCNDEYTDTDRDNGMSKIFEEIKSLSNKDDNMIFWSFNNKIDKWQEGNKELYSNGLGIKVDTRYTFYIVACPVKDFYISYSTNL